MGKYDALMHRKKFCLNHSPCQRVCPARDKQWEERKGREVSKSDRLTEGDETYEIYFDTGYYTESLLRLFILAIVQ